MKPKAVNEHEDGLLEYLEDIIGSNKYIERIAEVMSHNASSKINVCPRRQLNSRFLMTSDSRR